MNFTILSIFYYSEKQEVSTESTGSIDRKHGIVFFNVFRTIDRKSINFRGKIIHSAVKGMVDTPMFTVNS